MVHTVDRIDCFDAIGDSGYNVSCLHNKSRNVADMWTRTICFASQEAGTTKTSSAVNLAGCWGAEGRKVLLVDLDSQCSASRWCGVEDGGDGLLHVFTGAADLQWRASTIPGVDVVAATPWLSSIDRALSHAEGAETNLRDALRRLPRRWDLIVLDSPPQLGIASLSGLVAATDAVIPFEPTPLAMGGLRNLMNAIAEVKGRWNPTLDVSIVPCKVPWPRLSREVAAAVKEEYGHLLLEQEVRTNVRVEESPSHEECIVTYAPSCHGPEEYLALAAALMRHAPVSN